MKKIMIAAAAVLLCTSCFHVNKNYKQGDTGDFVEGFQEGFSEGRKASRKPIKGEGAVVSKSFDLKDFDQIVINGHADVSFTQSDAYEVTVRTQENILEWLDYKVEGTTLVIEAKDKREIRAEEYDLVIQAPALKKLVVNGASDFNVGSLRSEEDLDIEINGAGDLDFDRIQCSSLTLEVNGAADANLTSISVQKDLKVEVNGAGDVKVTGNAQSASFSVNGAGDIDATGLKVAGEVSKHTSGLASIKL